MVRAFAGDSTITREKPLFLLEFAGIKIDENVKMGNPTEAHPDIIALIYTLREDLSMDAWQNSENFALEVRAVVPGSRLAAVQTFL